MKSKKVEITDDKLIEEDLTKEELSNSIGKIIRELRLSKKMSLECLSNETGIGYSQLSRIERGKINTSIYQIYLIIKTLNVPINTLLEVLITDVIRSYKQKNKKYIKNKINKSIMKKITLFLLSCVLLATACNQSSTNPTVPPATTVYSIDSSYYFKINFNGQNLSQYSVFANYGSSGSGYVGFPGGMFLPATLSANSGGLINLYLQNSNVLFALNLHRTGDTINNPIGSYDMHYYGGGSGACSITDLTTSKVYDTDSASTTLYVTNTNATSISGTMTGKLNDGTTLIPFTGSFCLKKL